MLRNQIILPEKHPALHISEGTVKENQWLKREG
jgi:hypothetical protein